MAVMVKPSAVGVVDIIADKFLFTLGMFAAGLGSMDRLAPELASLVPSMDKRSSSGSSTMDGDRTTGERMLFVVLRSSDEPFFRFNAGLPASE